MNIRLKKNFFFLLITQLLIITLCIIYHRKITLNHYIDISFYFSSALLLSALLLYTIHSGFYDTISRSFNYAFSRGKEKRKFEDIPRLSDMVTINEKPFLFHGILNGLLMLAALLVYYV